MIFSHRTDLHCEPYLDETEEYRVVNYGGKWYSYHKIDTKHRDGTKYRAFGDSCSKRQYHEHGRETKEEAMQECEEFAKTRNK